MAGKHLTGSGDGGKSGPQLSQALSQVCRLWKKLVLDYQDAEKYGFALLLMPGRSIEGLTFYNDLAIVKTVARLI